jgi:hypothetical protein
MEAPSHGWRTMSETSDLWLRDDGLEKRCNQLAQQTPRAAAGQAASPQAGESSRRLWRIKAYRLADEQGEPISA